MMLDSDDEEYHLTEITSGKENKGTEEKVQLPVIKGEDAQVADQMMDELEALLSSAKQESQKKRYC